MEGPLSRRSGLTKEGIVGQQWPMHCCISRLVLFVASPDDDADDAAAAAASTSLRPFFCSILGHPHCVDVVIFVSSPSLTRRSHLSCPLVFRPEGKPGQPHPDPSHSLINWP